jgi:SMI1/KNR4 family protein SUKH-1
MRDETWPPMTERGPVVTRAAIAAFEAKLGAKLPDDYADFLLRRNGGQPLPSHSIFTVKLGSRVDSTPIYCGLMPLAADGPASRRCCAEPGVPGWTGRSPAHTSVISGGHAEGGDIVKRGITGELVHWTLPSSGQVIEACGDHERCAILLRRRRHREAGAAPGNLRALAAGDLARPVEGPDSAVSPGDGAYDLAAMILAALRAPAPRRRFGSVLP